MVRTAQSWDSPLLSSQASRVATSLSWPLTITRIYVYGKLAISRITSTTLLYTWRHVPLLTCRARGTWLRPKSRVTGLGQVSGLTEPLLLLRTARCAGPLWPEPEPGSGQGSILGLRDTRSQGPARASGATPGPAPHLTTPTLRCHPTPDVWPGRGLYGDWSTISVRWDTNNDMEDFFITYITALHQTK